jgi:hypothetical protein
MYVPFHVSFWKGIEIINFWVIIFWITYKQIHAHANGMLEAIKYISKEHGFIYKIYVMTLFVTSWNYGWMVNDLAVAMEINVQFLFMTLTYMNT